MVTREALACSLHGSNWLCQARQPCVQVHMHACMLQTRLPIRRKLTRMRYGQAHHSIAVHRLQAASQQLGSPRCTAHVQCMREYRMPVPAEDD